MVVFFRRQVTALELVTNLVGGLAGRRIVKRHPELLTGRHEELTPMVFADVKQAASEPVLRAGRDSNWLSAPLSGG
jgi:hypothetical protein